MPAMDRLVLLYSIFVCSFASSMSGYDPDVDLTAPEIIRRHGYPSETHIVQTDDGYLLSVHRIPNGKRSAANVKRPVVFLQHGVLGSSADWIINGPDKSLSYLLADNEYDVWLGNSRGNTYSRGHVNLSTSDLQFWKFTWHEMAVFDLPAEIDYVLQKTGQERIFYIGHSMGTTMFFAMAASKPEYNLKIKAMIALAPVVFMTHMKSPVRLLAPWAEDLEFWSRYLGAGAFLPQNKVVSLLARFGCEAVTFQKKICKNLIFILCGFDESQFNMTMLPLVLSHTPAGTSTKTLVHFAQEINTGKFQQYDYGTSENEIKYNSSSPPEYDLSAISCPVALHYADNDWMASVIDVNHLFEKLQNPIGAFLVNFKGFNHLDFIYGKDARTLVYDKVLWQLNHYRT